MSVFRRRVVFRDGRDVRLFGGASIVTAAVMAASVVFGGTALGSTPSTTGEASAPIEFGGGSVSSITIEVSGTGAVTLGGSALGIRVNAASASGAVAFAGSARPDLLASGSISFGGSATVGAVFTMDAAAAIAFAGTAAPVVLSASSGTVVFAGSLGVPEVSGGTVESAATGGIAWAGTAAGTIGAALNVPDQFFFETVFNATPGAQVTSAPSTIQGNQQSATLIVTNGFYSVNGGEFSQELTTVSAGDVLRVRHTASPEKATSIVTTVNISGVTGYFVSITESAQPLSVWKRRVVVAPKRRKI